MTLPEAMKLSKETGHSFGRSGSAGPISYGGWLKYDPKHYYRDLAAIDLMADDWEMNVPPNEAIS